MFPGLHPKLVRLESIFSILHGEMVVGRGEYPSVGILSRLDMDIKTFTPASEKYEAS